MILDVSRMLAVPTDLDRLLVRIAEIACGLLCCERASIFLHDPIRGELWTKVALKSEEIRLPCTAGIVGHTFSRNEVVSVPDAYGDPRFHRSTDAKTGFVTRNLLSAPMKGLDGKPLGVIQTLNKLEGTFGDADLALIELLADQGGVAVQRHRLQMQAVESAELRREMDLARRAQEKLIPQQPPGVPGLRAVGWTAPASVTGGDCFDLWRLGDGRLGVLLADASGHGLAPAMIVAQARSLVRALSETEPDPHWVLYRVNERLMDDLESGHFVTAFLAFISSSGVMSWSSAGHGPVLMRAAPGESLVTLDPPVQPLGILPLDEEAPQPAVLRERGSLIVVSDGIFEAKNPAGEFVGTERMIETIEAHQGSTPEDLLAGLRELAHSWYAGREPLDDQTIVIVQREGGTG